LSSDVIDATKWGWRLSDNRLEPIMSDQLVAPEDILKVIRCKCKGGCGSTICSCRKNGLMCVSACGTCHGEKCSNTETLRRETVASPRHDSLTNVFYLEDMMNDWELDYVDEKVQFRTELFDWSEPISCCPDRCPVPLDMMATNNASTVNSKQLAEISG
jgi:hypothetical protein